MEEKHRKSILDMMRVFYASPAVLTNGSEEIFEAEVYKSNPTDKSEVTILCFVGFSFFAS